MPATQRQPPTANPQPPATQWRTRVAAAEERADYDATPVGDGAPATVDGVLERIT
jgi:hypothetical protein